MVNKQKKYLGSLQNPEQAARLYDKVVIQQQGLKAKTNFSYTRDDLVMLLRAKSFAWQIIKRGVETYYTLSYGRIITYN